MGEVGEVVGEVIKDHRDHGDAAQDVYLPKPFSHEGNLNALAGCTSAFGLVVASVLAGFVRRRCVDRPATKLICRLASFGARSFAERSYNEAIHAGEVGDTLNRETKLGVVERAGNGYPEVREDACDGA